MLKSWSSQQPVMRGGGPVGAARQIISALGDSLIYGRANLHSARTGADPAPTNARVYINNTSQGGSNGTLTDTAAPLWMPDGTDARISPMEKVLIDYQSLTGKPVGFISGSVGGSALTVGWKPTPTYGANLTAYVAAHNAAMALYWDEDPAATVAGVVMCLTSNNNENSAEGQAAWLALETYLRANLDGVDADTPIIGAGPVSFGTTWDENRLDLETSASQRQNFFVMHPPFPTVSGDGLHPTLAENRVWGANLATLLYTANYGTQAFPTLSTSTTQGLIEGDTLSINLTHSGLSLASRYGVPVISGGADAAEFVVGGTFLAPVLNKSGAGTLAEGVYNVSFKMRNSAFDLSGPYNMTLTVSAPVVVSPTFTYSEGFANITGAYGNNTFTGVDVKTGGNLFIFFASGYGASKSASWTTTIDGNAATRVVYLPTGRSIEMWGKNSGIVTEVTAYVSYGAHQFPMMMQSISKVGMSAAPVSTGYLDKGLINTASSPPNELVCGTITVPAGGKAIIAVCGEGPIEPVPASTGWTKIGYIKDPVSNYRIATYERSDTGGGTFTVTSGGNAYYSAVWAVFGPEA